MIDEDALYETGWLEVLPAWATHDGWAGAAGAEIHDETYEPYPHEWDREMGWCRIRTVFWQMDLHRDAPTLYPEPTLDDAVLIGVDDVPGWILRRALPRVVEQWGA